MLLRLGRSSCWRRVAPQCAVKHRRGARSGFPANIGAAVCACAWGAPAIARREACQCQEQQPVLLCSPCAPLCRFTRPRGAPSETQQFVTDPLAFVTTLYSPRGSLCGAPGAAAEASSEGEASGAGQGAAGAQGVCPCPPPSGAAGLPSHVVLFNCDEPSLRPFLAANGYSKVSVRDRACKSPGLRPLNGPCSPCPRQPVTVCDCLYDDSHLCAVQ